MKALNGGDALSQIGYIIIEQSAAVFSAVRVVSSLKSANGPSRTSAHSKTPSTIAVLADIASAPATRTLDLGRNIPEHASVGLKDRASDLFGGVWRGSGHLVRCFLERVSANCRSEND
jgi:hypothetical protein